MKNKNKKIQKHENAKLTWINIERPKQKELVYLKRKFHFHNLHLEDCLPPLERPRIAEHDNYLFLILNFPSYNPKTREINLTEIDFFIGPNFIVSLHEKKSPAIEKLQKDFLKDKKFKEELFHKGPGFVLYEILKNSFNDCFPLLNDLSNDIEAVEKRIFTDFNQNIVREILLVKRNIVSFRKGVLAHKTILRKFLNLATRFFPTKKLEPYFNDLVDQTKEIWDTLENYKDTVNALHESNESLHSFRLNEIIKTLTIFSVIVFPLTLFAALFGMNTTNSMPFIGSDYDFWLVLVIMGIATIVMLFFFKKKRWL